MYLEINGNRYDDVKVQRSKYMHDESLAVAIWSDKVGCIAIITKCLDDPTLKQDEQYIDANNCGWVIDFLEKYKIAKPTGRSMGSGFCEYPLYKFNLDKIEDILE